MPPRLEHTELKKMWNGMDWYTFPFPFSCELDGNFFAQSSAGSRYDTEAPSLEEISPRLAATDRHDGLPAFPLGEIQ